MGTIQVFFQESGRIPVDSDRLNSLVREEEIDVTTAFNNIILADMPSGPVDFEASRLEIKSKSSSSLHKGSAGQSSGDSRDC